MELFYTGIGSRSTPDSIQTQQTAIANRLSAAGYILRSGGAQGSDTAFERGAGFLKHIYLPESGFNGLYEDGTNYFVHGPLLPMYHLSTRIAKAIHPAPERLSEYALLLHSRNIHQVVGHDTPLKPSEFILYYAEEDSAGIPKGGTRTAVMYARQLGITCYNLANLQTLERVLTISHTLKAKQ